MKLHRTGVKHFRHPVVGDLTLDFEALDLPGDSGQRMLVYSAEPRSPSHEGFSAGELGVDPTRRANGAQNLVELKPKRPIEGPQ